MGCCGGKEEGTKSKNLVRPEVNKKIKEENKMRLNGDNAASKKGLGLFASPSAEAGPTMKLRSVTCQGCGQKMLEQLLPFCPEKNKVTLRNGLQFTDGSPLCRATVKETVTAMLRSEMQALKAHHKVSREQYSAARIQRWWRRVLLHRLWFGALFNHLYRKLDKWQERDKTRLPANTHIDGNKGQPEPVDRTFSNGLTWPPEALHNSDDKDSIVKAVVAIVGDGERLPASFVKPLLIEAEAHLKKRSNIQRVTLEAHGSCVVVGDLHGQLADLLRILREFGLPDKNRHYVFNGDFVDRGPKGCEVSCLILTLLLAYPEQVFMNRGNHEDEPMCENYEFMEEVLNKYSSTNYQRFLRVFRAIPLCTIVHDEVFVVHGGVPRDPVTLGEINSCNRFRDIPMVSNKAETYTTIDKRMIADMTWSDPVEDDPFEGFPKGKTYMHNMDRGNGIWYKKEHTESFLRRNALRLLIRSHEAPDPGFALHHDSMAVTIFSASYYAGIQRNDGAVAVITLESKQHHTSPQRQGLSTGNVVIGFDTWKVYEETEGVIGGPEVAPALHGAGVIQEVLRVTRDFVHDHRHRLMTAFTSRDELRQAGAVGCLEWSHFMRDVSGCYDVPWEFIRPWMAEAVWPTDTEEVLGTTSIPFPAFLRRFAVPLEDRLFRKWAPNIVRWIWHRAMSTSVRGDRRYSDARALFDSACPEGCLMTYQRFFSLIVNDLQTQLSSDIVFQLFCYFDKEGGMPGYLRRENWERHFEEAELHGVQTDEVEEEEELDAEWILYDNTFHMWDYWLVQRLRDHVKRCVSPIAAFKMFDSDGDGVLGIEDLKSAIDRLGLSRLQCPARRTTYQFAAKPGTPKEAIEMTAVGELFGITDKDVNLIASRDPATTGLVATITTWPLSNTQLTALLHNLDYDGDGKVTLEDFLRAFYVVDLNETAALLVFHEPIVPKKHSFQSHFSLVNSPSSPKKALEQACASFRKVKTRSGSIALSEVYPAGKSLDALAGIQLLSDGSESEEEEDKANAEKDG
eukprot:TRINITY_DN570_c3_g1_i1.p1 TRINITY_DN570_c3_g1~~TRINITY_DN570_c3_g1_i1.p1  ORF type:complete len:1020 (+),score=111.06 TRINITY_DN570_c3_g1_i1:71-3130(+)